jgi:hypothetical protein
MHSQFQKFVIENKRGGGRVIHQCVVCCCRVWRFPFFTSVELIKLIYSAAVDDYCRRG